MQLWKHLLITACLTWGATGLVAQQIPFVSYTPKDGLVNNRVKKMLQDSKGQLYFLTFVGLSIYDGTSFTNFSKADGLGSDVVNDAVEMGDDSVWIATNTNTLNYISKGSVHTFKTADGFYPIINSFYKNKKGQLFAACDEGLFVFANNRFINLPLYNNEKYNNQEFLSSVYQADNYLLIITDLSLGPHKRDVLLYDLQKKTTIASIKQLGCTSITEIEDNVYLLGAKPIQLLDKKQLQKGKIVFKPLPSKYTNLITAARSFIFFDSQKNLWSLQGGGGMHKIDTSGAVEKYSVANGLLSNNVSSIFEDSENTLWFVNDNYGVQKLVNNSTQLTSRPFNAYINSFATSAKGDTVYYWDMQAQKLFLQTKATTKVFFIKNINPGTTTLSLSGSNLYLNNTKNIYHFSLSQFKNAVITPSLIYTDTSINNMNISFVDASGAIIIQGAYRINTIINYNTINSYPVKYYIDQGAADSKGRLWFVSRASELYVMKTGSLHGGNYLQLLKDFSPVINIKAPRSVVADKQDNIWVGTRDNGLYCFKIDENLQLKLLHHFNEKDGLTASFITTLFCDTSGAVWAGTPSGIDKLTWQNKSIVIDNVSKRSNLYPYIYLIKQDKHNNILALTIDGSMLKIGAQQNNPKTFTPQLFIKYIKAGDLTYSGSLLPINYSYKQYNISIHTASPSFYDEKQIKYSYILEGTTNSSWSEPNTNAVLQFINLSPGKYNLKIKASYPAKKYADKIINYAFIISPPWWQSWWFNVLTALTLVTALIFFIRNYYKRKLKKQKTVLENQQAIEKERSRIAADIHDDLGAGLSTLRFLSEKVKRNSFSETTKNDAEKIVANSNELVQKMNELIWAMNEKNDTLEDLLFYARAYAAEYAEENNLQLHITLSENIPALLLTGEIRRNVFLTIKETLHNIVKHAGAKNVFINIKTTKNLFITIHDDGTGFKIFNEEGNGLKNMKKRMETIGGICEIINNNGVTVNITVPVGKLSSL